MRTSTASAIENELRRVPNSTTGGYTPYCPIYYYTSGAPHDAGGSWTRFDNLGSKNRVIDVRASIEPFSATCTITLDNADGSYTSTASTYKGKWLKISWGLTVSGTGRIPAEGHPYFYCTGYTWVSDLVNGRAVKHLRLYGEGAWNRLGRLMAVPDLETTADGASYYFNQPTMDATRNGKDADDIFSDLCDMAGIWKGTIGTISDYVTTWNPELTFDYDTTVAGHVGPTADIACMLLLQPFRVRAVPRADALLLTLPDTTTDWTFKCPTDVNFQPFISGSKTSQEAYPAKVAVVNGSYGGTYGTSSVGGYNYALAEAWNIGSSNTNCAWIAQSIVEWIAEQQDSGIIEVPVLNPLMELYDYVTVIDQRGNCSTTTGRVGGLSYQYTPSQGIYSMRVRLGGVWGLPEGVTELTGGKPEPTKGSGSSSGGSSSSGGGSSGSGSSNYNNRSTVITGLSSYVPGIRAGELVIGDLVTGDLADLDTKDYSDLNGLPTSLGDISNVEYTTLTYAKAAIGGGGLLKTYIYGPGLQDLTGQMEGKVKGLYLTKTHMGYWNGSSWNNYFDNAGNGYFRGTIYAANVATGYTLTVQGNIDVITSGTSFAGVRIGTHTINGWDWRGISLVNTSGAFSYLRFFNSSGLMCGTIHTSGTYLYVAPDNYNSLWLKSWGDMIVRLETDGAALRPAETNNYTLGSSSAVWATVYASAIRPASGRSLTVTVSGSGQLFKVIGVPTADPGVLGAIYCDPATRALYVSWG